MKKYDKNGISLIMLIITIIVVLIIASAVIINLTNTGGVLDNAKKSRFMSDYRSVEEGVSLYSTSNINMSNPDVFPLPLESKLSLSDKQDITNNVPTLNTKIEELNPGKTIDDIDLYYINEAEAGINNLASNKQEKGYIIDAATRQIYDYVGDSFEGKRWHTLDGGVVETGLISEPGNIQEMWNGWIKLTLYYPASSTDKKWRLGSEGEIRVDPMLMWQNYTGPITIPLDRTKDVWIKYKLNNVEVTIPPAGTLLVDIVPDKTGTTKVSQVNVNINYDESATIKEYRVGESGWMTYTAPFVVTENCIIEARGKKTENVYNIDGSLLLTRDIAGSDMVYIGNIGMEETTLVAPTITRLPAVGSEKVRVQVTYPANADKKIYTVNYGIEENYTSEINVQNYGTYIIAYYYDASGKKSASVSIYINDTTTGSLPIESKPHEPLPPYDPVNPPLFDPNTPTSINLPAPTITRLLAVGGEKARVQITYPTNAYKKIYTQDYGVEQTYSQDIVVSSWGTFIMAYYYDADGNKSQISYIRINENVTPPDTYTPPETLQSIPIAPTININPNVGLVTEVSVSVSSPGNAGKTYIKIGRYGDYVEYTSSIVVRDNVEIYAYYKISDGTQSQEARARIENTYKPGDTVVSNTKPYVYIDAAVYPWSGTYGQNDVSVTILYSNANKIEYSEDGIVYKPYTVPFKVTENKRIYAKGTNVNGVSETYLDITNIGKLTVPKSVQNLAININVNPEPSLATVQVAKATVSIEYDATAVEKYYRIGANGDLQVYTAAFDVDKSCTIYAYAKAPNSLGQTAKTIDNIIDGISDPVITAAPSNQIQASKVGVKIDYDKYATIKRYSIDGGSLRDYTGDIEVTKNGTKIYAYSQNVKGQSSNATYTIENIVPPSPVLALDKGNYYILKLNYPEGSAGKEYKWTATGAWNSYKDAGIMLIKPQFKDQVIQNGTLVKIEDENGKLVTFTGDYYLINVPISEMFENIFMRWDRVTPGAPQIILNTTDPAIQVTATIVYDPSLITKQYRVLNPGEILGDWQDYTGPITVDRNNAIIYSKGMDESELWSSEGMLKVSNIDENPPVINLTADLDTAQQKVAVKVSITDDVLVGKVKWAPGIQGESYFTNSGTEIANNSIVNITSNGYYTFYAEDKVGNKQVYTLNVTNVDLNPPLIDIAVSPESTVGLTANVTINYGDSTIKQYKVGTSNAVWTNYTTTFVISSYTILANNWQNTDGTVTIYAKGKDTAGNEITVQKKVLSLDLDKPILPVINSRASYPILAPYGTIFDDVTTITYDSRTDIDNYYSIDNGVTWKAYTTSINVTSGTIIAKSIKKGSGLEVSTSQTVTAPADAMKSQAYDGNVSTYISNATNQYMAVDNSMQGKNIRVKWNVAANTASTQSIVFLDENRLVISQINKTIYNQNIMYDEVYNIPLNTKWIKALNIYGLYEIQTSNEPTFSSTNEYMLLTFDPTKAIRAPYQLVTINYFPTSVQRLYKIETTGNWLNYTDQPIKLIQGQTIYTKGIDQYGNETRIISSYTAIMPDAIAAESYDKNNTTYTFANNRYMKVDSSVQGKKIWILWNRGAVGNTGSIYLKFLDENKNVIDTLSRSAIGTYNDTYTVPINTKWIMYTYDAVLGNYNALYEIGMTDEPTISSTNGYMLLTADPINAIKDPYQSITISYFSTSVQRLYRIGTTGSWLNYNDQPIKVAQGQTIYAKGIDQYGNETRLIPSYTAIVTDALTKEVYDTNDATGLSNVTNKFMEVDSSMQGRNIRVKWNVAANSSSTQSIVFLDENKLVISQINKTIYNQNIMYDEVYNIPLNTKFIKVVNIYYLYEIQPSNEPTFTKTDGYMFLSLDALKQVREPYQMITANYFPTSVQKLYRIGTTGSWLNYTQPVKLNQGLTIYAKGVDLNGVETRVISSYTSNVPDALKKEAYDGNDVTYAIGGANSYIEVDSALQGRSVRFKWVLASGLSGNAYIIFLDQNKLEISRISKSVNNSIGNYNEMITIPINTKWISYLAVVNGYSYMYEIQP